MIVFLGLRVNRVDVIACLNFYIEKVIGHRTHIVILCRMRMLQDFAPRRFCLFCGRCNNYLSLVRKLFETFWIFQFFNRSSHFTVTLWHLRVFIYSLHDNRWLLRSHFKHWSEIQGQIAVRRSRNLFGCASQGSSTLWLIFTAWSYSCCSPKSGI